MYDWLVIHPRQRGGSYLRAWCRQCQCCSHWWLSNHMGRLSKHIPITALTGQGIFDLICQSRVIGYGASLIAHPCHLNLDTVRYHSVGHLLTTSLSLRPCGACGVGLAVWGLRCVAPHTYKANKRLFYK